MFGEEATVGIGMTALVAGAAAAFSIVAFYFYASASAEEAKFKKRMDAMKEHRSAIRAAAVQNRAVEKKKDNKVAAMSETLGRLKLESQLNDATTKKRLLRAGKRDRGDLVRFVFMQFALPPLFALVFVLLYRFGWRPEEFSMLHAAGAGLGGLMIGYIWPGMQIDKAAEARQKAIRRAYPDALDLLTICVESGMSVEQAFNKVASELGATALELSEELQVTTAELSYLGDRRQALENFAERTNMPEVKAIVSALIQADKYGTPLGQALRVISAESRFDRMARAETKAASLPALLTVPMMLFFVPVLFVVIIGPAVIQTMQTFNG